VNGAIKIIEITAGRDRKRYPAAQLSAADLGRLRKLEHQLCHRDGLSVRQAQRALLGQHGVRRSVGAIQRDLAGWVCQLCEDGWPPPPEPPAARTVAGAGYAGPALPG
jgi:hypothetical protein